MKKTILGLSLIFMLASCGSGSQGAIDTVENAAQTYCDAATEAENASEQNKDQLNKVLNDLENKIEKEHEDDNDWFNDFEERVEELCQKG